MQRRARATSAAGHCRTTWCVVVLFLLTISGGTLSAEERDLGFEPARRSPNGPWNADLLIFQSHDGKSFTGGKTFVERAGVPCVIRDAKDRLIAVVQWFPFDRSDAFDKVAVLFSSDEGATWSKPQPIVVASLPEGAQRPFDPTLTLLDDGTVRLYFTSTMPTRRRPAIYSAVSSDGIHYRFESGLRFAVEHAPTVDAAVTRMEMVWHLFAPLQAADNVGYHAISDDGLTFRRLPDVAVPVPGSWIGNVVARNGSLWFYGSGAREGWLATSKNGTDWELASASLRVGGDPAVVKLKDGTDLLIATGRRARVTP